MEGTGIYWKSLYADLEAMGTRQGRQCHVKHVPGRKTDMADAQWLALLAEAGLLRASLFRLLSCVSAPDRTPEAESCRTACPRRTVCTRC